MTTNTNVPTHYASLTGPLLGLYFPLPNELTDDHMRRAALNTSKLRSLWCSIYTAEEVRRATLHCGTLLPSAFSLRLDYDSHQVYHPTAADDLAALEECTKQLGGGGVVD